MSEYTNPQFKIISDGTTDGTILVGPNNTPIGMCEKLVWEMSSDSTISKLQVTLINVPIEVTVPEENVTVIKKSVQEYADEHNLTGFVEQFNQVQK